MFDRFSVFGSALRNIGGSATEYGAVVRYALHTSLQHAFADGSEEPNT